jgi:DNA-binding transcriptional LysR family regulator
VLAGTRVIRPKDLVGEAFIAMEPTTPLRHRIDVAFADSGVAYRTRAETPLSMIACGLVASGAGVSIIDPLSALEYVGQGIVMRPFLPRIQFDIVLLRPAHRALSPLAQEFADEFGVAIEKIGRQMEAGIMVGEDGHYCFAAAL